MGSRVTLRGALVFIRLVQVVVFSIGGPLYAQSRDKNQTKSREDQTASIEYICGQDEKDKNSINPNLYFKIKRKLMTDETEILECAKDSKKCSPAKEQPHKHQQSDDPEVVLNLPYRDGSLMIRKESGDPWFSFSIRTSSQKNPWAYGYCKGFYR